MGKNSFWVLYTERDKMKYKIIYKVGQDLREKTIIAENLDEAEIKANKLVKCWIDIINTSLMRRGK